MFSEEHARPFGDNARVLRYQYSFKSMGELTVGSSFWKLNSRNRARSARVPRADTRAAGRTFVVQRNQQLICGTTKSFTKMDSIVVETGAM